FNGGTVFQIGTDGSGLGLLHQFASGPGDGNEPFGAPIQSGSTLYGMNSSGGNVANSTNGLYQYGTVFKVNTDGSGYATLHNFAGGPGDGQHPLYATPVVSGSTLYGMTPGGGADALGTIFGLQTDGTGFSVLHSFAGGAADGASPQSDLILSGSTFYGMTVAGGSSNLGTVFSFPIPEPSSLALA